MSCKSMKHYQELVSGMSKDELQRAAQKGFDTVNELEEREEVVVGLCSAAALYKLNIKEMASISRLENLSEAMERAESMDQTEQFNAGLKSFFAVNYAPTEQRDAIFTGYYASAAASGIDVSKVAAKALAPGPTVGPVDTVW